MESATHGQRAPSAIRSTAAWRHLGSVLGLAVVLGGGCTFYTGQPQASQQPGAAGAPSNGGNGSILPGLGDAGEGGAGAVSEWADATGNLTGRTHSQGVVFVTAAPDSETLIAGVGNDGLYSSIDGGATWQGLGQTGASDQITNRATSIVFDPDHPQTFWETGIDMGGGLYRSTDNGKTIAELGTDSLRQTDLVSVDFSDSKRRTLLVGGHGQPKTIFMSTDAGGTWTSPDTIPDGYGPSGYPLVLDSHTFLLGVTNAILRSTDAGDSWTTVSKAGGAGAPVRTPEGSIYWLIDGIPPPGMCSGVMRSDDQGLTWERAVGAGILNGELIALPDGSLASGTSTNLIVSHDKGSTWTVISRPLPFPPKGLLYSKALKAFFIWRDTPNEAKVPALSIARYDWDYEGR